MGFLPEGEEKNFYQSAKINLCLHEKHSQDYGFDVTEKFFKLAISNLGLELFSICIAPIYFFNSSTMYAIKLLSLIIL
jgi:hypothetical protein